MTKKTMAVSVSSIQVSSGVRFEVPVNKIIQCVEEHASGNWGDLEDYLQQQMEHNLRKGKEVYSRFDDVYNGEPLFVYTTGDRTKTVVCYQEEL